MSQTRRLAAILAADVAGNSRLMGAEEGTLERLQALRRELLDPRIAEQRGRIVKTTGDGLLVEFASVVDAVRCAVGVQQAMPEAEHRSRGGQPHRAAHRHQLSDVIVEGDDLYGDGANIAARLEALADAGGVFVSSTVHDHVCDQPSADPPAAAPPKANRPRSTDAATRSPSLPKRSCRESTRTGGRCSARAFRLLERHSVGALLLPLEEEGLDNIFARHH